MSKSQDLSNNNSNCDSITNEVKEVFHAPIQSMDNGSLNVPVESPLGHIGLDHISNSTTTTINNINKNDSKDDLLMSLPGSMDSGDEVQQCVTDDEVEEYAGGSFEGPEKTLEVVFRPGTGAPNGLRTLTRAQIDNLCESAKCSILTKMSNNYVDSYVLSESSLFVYRHRYIMKTCGTTTLLRCLKSLLEYADELGMELTWVGYSRKNLSFPNAQLWPHSNFGEEIKYIDSHSKLQERLRGKGHILGPVTGDHWFVYVADLFPLEEFQAANFSRSSSLVNLRVSPPTIKSNTAPATPPQGLPSLSSIPSVLSSNSLASTGGCSAFGPSERTINLMMFGLASETCSIFYQKNTPTARQMTINSGINNLCLGATIDDTMFTPCGYSMNAILHDAYYTIHITPEEQCSYASFETNTCLKNYSAMIRNVLGVFKPSRFVLTMFGDESGIKKMNDLPSDHKKIVMPGNHGTYLRTSMSNTVVENDLSCTMACYSLSMERPLMRVDSLTGMSNANVIYGHPSYQDEMVQDAVVISDDEDGSVKKSPTSSFANAPVAYANANGYTCNLNLRERALSYHHC